MFVKMQITEMKRKKQYEWSGIPWQKWRISAPTNEKAAAQALTRLMQQKDFQSITVTDVVREADINRGTFYAHYRDVYDLRDKIETGMIEDFRGMIAAIRPS